MIVTYSNRTYRITYQSIALVENALGNPNLIQISLTTDCEVKVAPMPEYDINYLPNGEYRSWQLTGINTKLNRKEQHFIYARLEREGKDALLVFSVNDYNVDGTIGEGTTPSEYYYYIKLGKITATDAVEGATVMREVTLDYGYLATPADREDNFFQLRTDENGNEYIITKYQVMSEKSYTSYASPEAQVPSIFDGIPIDNDTIYWEEVDGIRKLKAKGGGEGTVSEETLWQILANSGNQQINSTHLTDALKNYITGTDADEKISEATKNFVTLDSEQEIVALKHFTAGLSVGAGKHKIYEKDGVVYFDGDLAVTGGITQYVLGERTVSTIMDGVVTDGVTITKQDGKLVVIGGTGSDFNVTAMWAALAASTTEQINKSHLTDALSGYATTEQLNAKWTQDDAKIANWDTAFSWGNHATFGYAHLAGEETFTGLKHFTAGLSVGAGKHKLYEKDGVVYFDGDLAVTGGITQYALGDTKVSTIMDGVVVDGTTIAKVNGVLKVLNAGGGEAGSVDWSNVMGKPTTLAGYGITDAPTKTGGGASGTWGIEISGNAATASKWATARTITLGSYLSGSASLDGSANVTLNANVIGLTSQGNKTAVTGNTAPANGVRLYQVYINGYPSNYGNLLSVKGIGAGELLLSWHNSNRIYYRSLRDNGDNWLGWSTVAFLTDNVASATKLQNTRTIWGKSFNGEQNINGDLREVNNIYTNGGTIDAKVFGYSPYDSHDGMPWYGFKYNKNNHIAISGYAGIDFYTSFGHTLSISSNGRTYANSVVTDNWFRSEGNTGWYSETWGGGWYMQDSNWIRAYNGKSVYTTGDICGTTLIYRDIATTGVSAPNYFLDNRPAIKCEQDLTVIANDTVRPILRWGDAVSNVGYNTRYIIGSVRQGYDWGRIFMAVSNNDIGTSEGCSFSVYGSGYAAVNGNFLATGGITQYSDQRAKTIIEQINLSLKDIAQSPTIRFKWNGWKQKDDGKTHIGGIAQYVQNILPEAIYNSDDVLTMDYATTGYVFAVNTAKHLLNYETKTDKEIKQLKKRVKYLEKQLKKLGYEETGTLAN